MKQPPKVPESVYSDTRGDFLALILAAQRACGDVFTLSIGPPQVIVCHPDLAYEILVEKADVYAKLGAAGKPSGLSRVLGRGLLTNPDPASWARQRRMVQPAFHKARIARFVREIEAAGERLTGRLAASEGRPFNLSEAIDEVTLELTHKLIFGRMPGPRIEVPLSLATARNSRAKAARERSLTSLKPLVQRRRQERAVGEIAPGDILDMLLDARDAETGAPMTDAQLFDELLTLFSAGHETVANALIWSVYALAQAPEVEARLAAALQAGEAPYIEALFKESLRLYPVIPAAPRVALALTELAGFDISEGTRVLVSLYALHHHPEFWDAPEAFRPERFMGDASHHPHTYLPFGLGARYCVGRNLAMLEGPLLLTCMVRSFRLTLANEETFKSKIAISLGPRQPLRVVPIGRAL